MGGTFSYNMMWEAYAITEFDGSCKNDMFGLIITEPSDTLCRGFLRGSIQRNFCYEEIVSKTLVSFFDKAARTLKSGGYFAEIL